MERKIFRPALAVAVAGCVWALHAAASAAPAAQGQGQWTAGMDDDAGKAAATSRADLPAADFALMRHIYPKRDRLETVSLDGTWAFKLVRGLEPPAELKGWNEPGWDVSDWDDIAVPGNWETQGFKSPQYGNQIDEMSGFYVRNFRWNWRWEGQRVILRFDGVLFGYEVWLNGKYVGKWGSAYNLAQWDVTDKLVKGRNTIAVKVMTRSHGWLFDTNDCWALAGIFRSVELFTVPNDYIADIVVRTDYIEDGDAEVFVAVEVAAFEPEKARAKKVYVSFTDEDSRHVLDFELDVASARASGKIRGAKLWSAQNPYLYTLSVTLVDSGGQKIERISEKQGIRTVRIVDKHLEINGEATFLNGVAWNEIDPVDARAITKEERRRQMSLMKKAGVNCIRTAHYPFGPDFLELCDEMGFYAIDEVPFGSRGRPLLEKPAYRDELIARTEATMRRDKNHASVIFWTFGNENSFTPNTKAVLAYAKAKDPTRPRGLPQIGSSQAKETLYHPERDVDFVSPHYLSAERMREYETNTTKALVQTEFAHACGNGFNDFEDRYSRMRARPDVWMGGCIWAWIDQSIMHPDGGEEFEKELSLTRTISPNHLLPKDLRRDLPRAFQGNYVDSLHFIDSWGDRATDGIVYGDGTPKDGYWLVKTLYTGKQPPAAEEIPAPLPDRTPIGDDFAGSFLLRIGRKRGMCESIQIMGGKKPYSHEEYLLSPEVLETTKAEDGTVSAKVKYVFADDPESYFEGVIALAPQKDGKVTVKYSFEPSEECKKLARFTELGLAVRVPGASALPGVGATRVDWVGDGPLSSVPGKSKMNVFGTWAMHKDDWRFTGNRSHVKWAMATRNAPKSTGSAARKGIVLESGTGNVSFENVEGSVILTENVTVAGYGGKAQGPGGLKSAREAPLKGEFKLYTTLIPAEEFAADVVPDMTFTQTYGF